MKAGGSKLAVVNQKFQTAPTGCMQAPDLTGSSGGAFRALCVSLHPVLVKSAFVTPGEQTWGSQVRRGEVK